MAPLDSVASGIPILDNRDNRYIFIIPMPVVLDHEVMTELEDKPVIVGITAIDPVCLYIFVRPPRTVFGRYCDSILVFQKFRHRESKDPRDKIYGVLGLQKLLCIAPDYDQRFSQVYMDLIL
ncbi:hypothetical protein B0T18DRAFT_441706 [Schizothecium vesticola]|uniref:Uncharacterized protein n=1 Tax=Schizothecium vesticola TaxID=314040 RepID=A0AA40KBS8_9PEZI|nr:hypothetical protein B0T18DRAFT_441706 [Schizothecium vesticola]